MIKLRAVNQTTEDVFECPQSWDETPTQTFQRIATEWDWENFVQLFSIISGIEYKSIRESTDGRLETKLVAAVQYIINPKKPIQWDKLPFPSHYVYRGKKIKLSKNSVTIGQSIAVKQAMQAYALKYMDNLKIKTFVKDFFFDGLIAYAASVYLQPILTGVPFDSELASDIESDLLKQPITEVYPIGFFLLVRSQANGQNLRQDSKPWTHSIVNGLARISKWTAKMRRRNWLRSQKRKDLSPTPI